MDFKGYYQSTLELKPLHPTPLSSGILGPKIVSDLTEAGVHIPVWADGVKGCDWVEINDASARLVCDFVEFIESSRKGFSRYRIHFSSIKEFKESRALPTMLVVLSVLVSLNFCLHRPFAGSDMIGGRLFWKLLWLWFTLNIRNGN
jgi:hypothetical protein